MNKFWKCWRKEHAWLYNAQRGWVITSRKWNPEGSLIKCHRCGATNRYVVEVPHITRSEPITPEAKP